MSERAQALEALHQEIDWMLGGVDATDSLTISAAILFRWKRTLAAVQTPPVGVSPQPDVKAKLMIAFCDGLDGTELSEDDHVFVKACLTQAMDVVLPASLSPVELTPAHTGWGPNNLRDCHCPNCQVEPTPEPPREAKPVPNLMAALKKSLEPAPPTPAPCVWREFPYVVTTCGQKRWWPTDMMAALREFKGCPYCLKPLEIDR